MFNPTVVKEILSLAILVVFIGLFKNSDSMMAHAAAYVTLVMMFAVYLISILGKTDRDEREEEHRGIASEAGFAVGGCMVLGGIAHQAFSQQQVDPWLFGVLIAMLGVRLLVRLYLEVQK